MKRSIHCSCFMVLLLGITSFLITPNSSALSYQDRVDVQFTFNPSISLSVSGDLIIDNLAPGSSSDSNVIDVTVNSNNITGYVLTATAGNTSHADTDLTQSGVTNKFTSIATNASLSSLTTDDTWGYSFSSDTGTTWTNYSGLPLYTSASGAELASVNTNATTPIKFKIAAKASTTQVSGTYTNVVNFIAVANPEPQLEPVSCSPGHICYQPNALSGVEGTMADQDARQFDTSSCLWTDNSTVCLDSEGDPVNVDQLPKVDGVIAEKIMLYPSNYSRPGYGFAGWSDVHDYETNPNAHFYGTEEDIDVPAGTLENGTSLYAVWVRSAGSLQTQASQVCNSLTQAPINGTANLSSVSALTDQRDGQTYAIAKLADGNCWMIENLRVENTGASASSASLSQGYDSSFIGLANPESANFYYTTVANSLYSINGSTAFTISGDYRAYRFPRYNNSNTQQRAVNSSLDVNTYSYGNYYTWAAAIADTTSYEQGNHNTTSICPKGWSIPTILTNNQFSQLDVAIGGTGSNQTNNREATNRWRKFPNNFLYSGSGYNQSSVSQRYNRAHYWSASKNGSPYYATVISMQDMDISLTGVADFTTYGHSIRCIQSSQ